MMDSLAQKVVARFLTASLDLSALDDGLDVDMSDAGGQHTAADYSSERKFHLPPEARETKPLTPEGTDLEIYVWEGKRKARDGSEKEVKYAAAFAGKAGKPLWYYAFGTESNRIEEIRKTIERRKQFIDSKKKDREEKANFSHGLKVGDILYTSWGYDQTNIDFYQITDVRGKNVIMREIGKKVVEGHGGPSERVVPVPNHFVGEPLTKRPQGSGGRTYVRVTSYSSAHLWDGHPLHQTGAAYGH